MKKFEKSGYPKPEAGDHSEGGDQFEMSPESKSTFSASSPMKRASASSFGDRGAEHDNNGRLQQISYTYEKKLEAEKAERKAFKARLELLKSQQRSEQSKQEAIGNCAAQERKHEFMVKEAELQLEIERLQVETETLKHMLEAEEKENFDLKQKHGEAKTELFSEKKERAEDMVEMKTQLLCANGKLERTTSIGSSTSAVKADLPPVLVEQRPVGGGPLPKITSSEAFEAAVVEADFEQTLDVSRELAGRPDWDTHFGPRLAVFNNMELMKSKLDNIICQLAQRLVERDEVARIILLGLVAGQNVLLFGPPGTAKSKICSIACSYISDSAKNYGGSFFENQFHPSTTVDDIFGPVSLPHLEKGRFKRNVESFLPYKAVAFLDEAFKAHSSLLSALLSTLNERQYKNGDQLLENLPLWCTIVASNEVPLDAGAGALFDRLLLRVFVDYVSESARSDVMNTKFTDEDVDPKPELSIADFRQFGEWSKGPNGFAFPAESDAKPSWRCNVEEKFLVKDEDDARKLCQQFLKFDKGSWTVSKNARDSWSEKEPEADPDFDFQSLREGWELSLDKAPTSTSDLLEFLKNKIKGGEVVLLTFRTGAIQRKPYDLIREFTEHVREQDSMQEQLNANKKLSVEGGGRLSDRRLKQIVDLLRLVATTNARTYLSVPDLYIMVYCCWKTKEDFKDIASWWLLRLQRELRGMNEHDYKRHEPKDHLWLSAEIRKQLEVGGKQQEEPTSEQKTIFLKQVLAKSREKGRARDEFREAARESARIAFEIKQKENEQKYKALLEQKRRERDELKQSMAHEEELARIEADKQKDNDLMLAAKKKKLEAQTRALEQRIDLERERAQKEQEYRADLQEKIAMEAKNAESRKVVKENTEKAKELLKMDDTAENVQKFTQLMITSEHPADLSLATTEGTGDSPLSYTVWKGRIGYIRVMFILQTTDRRLDARATDTLFDPPLVQATRWKAPRAKADEMIPLLVKMGCDIKQKGGEGKTCLHHACEMGQRQAIAAVIQAAKKELGGSIRSFVDQKDENGKSSLDYLNNSDKQWLQNLLNA